MLNCKCNTCGLGRRISQVVERRDPEEMADMIKELSSHLIMAQFDLDYFQAIIRGIWPNSEEILTKSLELAKQHKEQQDG